MKRVGWLSFSIVALLILDQITKFVVRTNFFPGESKSVFASFFSFTYVKNPGVAFGFLAEAPEAWRRPLLLAIPLIACIWLAVLIWQNRKSPNWLLGVSYALIFAGALGNLIDRFYLGFVVDFFFFFFKSSHFPAFNIADSCISVAAALLILDFILEYRRTSKKGKCECCHH